MQIDPKAATDWLDLGWKLALVVGAVLGFALRSIRGPLVTQINGLGGRLGYVESDLTTVKESVRNLERASELHAFQMSANSERMGAAQARTDRLEEMLLAQRQADSREDSEIKQRLAGIEAKIDVFGEMSEALVAIARHGGKS